MSLADSSAPDLFDVVTAPASIEPGEGAVAVELPADDAAALGALAARLGLAPSAIWRAAWALTLARLAGVSRVRVGRDESVAVIDVPADGELAPWLVDAALAGEPGPGRPPEEPAPQSAWMEMEIEQAPSPSESGPELRWHARGTAGASARFPLVRPRTYPPRTAGPMRAGLGIEGTAGG